jgi:hypothetical protein
MCYVMQYLSWHIGLQLGKRGMIEVMPRSFPPSAAPGSIRENLVLWYGCVKEAVHIFGLYEEDCGGLALCCIKVLSVIEKTKV